MSGKHVTLLVLYVVTLDVEFDGVNACDCAVYTNLCTYFCIDSPAVYMQCTYISASYGHYCKLRAL